MRSIITRTLPSFPGCLGKCRPSTFFRAASRDTPPQVRKARLSAQRAIGKEGAARSEPGDGSCSIGKQRRRAERAYELG
jgi:hypothetical protein